MENKDMNSQQILGLELRRKFIHFGSLIIPLLYYYTGFSTFMLIFVPLYAAWVFVDFQRRRKPEINAMFKRKFGEIFRDSEATNFTGATHLGIGILITVIFFHKHTAIMALAILAISDSCAAIIGMKYGQIKIGEKTLEGSAAFFVSGLLVVCIFNWLFGLKEIYLWENIIALALTTVLELYSKKLSLDDNIVIPVSFAIFVAMLETTI